MSAPVRPLTAEQIDRRAAAAAIVTECAAALAQAKEDFELAVCEYRETGVSLVTIGKAAGYSDAGIFGILSRRGVR